MDASLNKRISVRDSNSLEEELVSGGLDSVTVADRGATACNSSL